MKPSVSAIESLLEGTHADPFALLGVHAGPAGTFARVVLPGAEEAEAFSLDGRRLGSLGKVGACLRGGFSPIRSRSATAAARAGTTGW